MPYFLFKRHPATPAVAAQLVGNIIYQLIQDRIKFLVRECAETRNIGVYAYSPLDYPTEQRYKSLLQQFATNPHPAGINIDGMSTLKVCLTQALTAVLRRGILTDAVMSASSKPLADEIVGRLRGGGLHVKLTPASSSLFSDCIVRASVTDIPDIECVTQGIIEEVLPALDLPTADELAGTKPSYRPPQLSVI